MNNDFPYPGPVMLDVLGTELTADDRDVLSHPLVGGVILFARNFASCAQLADLTAAIRAVRTPPLLIAVDHEGGRVQRFREGFTRLPPMRQLGHLWDQDKERALSTAQAAGFVLASELRAHGVDLSFTPVLDLDYGHSTVIGDRAFHRKPEAVIKLASALLDGLAQAGMVGVGKHFPGHGFVAADSHLAIPVDERNIVELAGSDLAPFHALSSKLGGVMPAHVIYDQVDRGRPAGFSSYWLKQVLRSDLGFKGAIFSDDLSMAGAGVVGGIIERAQAAWSAGCDVLLVCNDRDAAHTLLDNWQPVLRAPSGQRWAKLTPAIPVPSLDAPEYQSSLAQVLALTV